MSDAELIALAALVNCEAVQMAGDNKLREMEGQLPMWREGAGLPPFATRLDIELFERRKRRGEV